MIVYAHEFAITSEALYERSWIGIFDGLLIYNQAAFAKTAKQ